MRQVAVAVVLALCSTLAGADDLFDEGKKVFTEQAQPSCSICHTLGDAGSTGAIGPNLNELQPTEDQVLNALNGGIGVMPDFSETLSQEQMKAVAHYVATAVNR
ncbi:MAG: SorU family sulfite dehydrogenase c-type cytochrome subunit [Marinobacter sp.]|uniref:SorU family sulfite dehydrogenase c-type cytochrome subunit n=1 Tax=Marinobacter sp. TaxID=50741 RepID=UPI003F985813